jgi:phosphoenolpyruvate carboxykinase (ATP)
VEPEATFSACFGAAFMVLHPARYAALLAEKIRRHGAQVWLVNTGWSGGPHGEGSRMKLAYTRAILDAIHSGQLAEIPTRKDPIFRFQVPTSCPGLPSEILDPRSTWSNPEAYDRMAARLAAQFQDNFVRYADQTDEAVRQAGPRA